MEIFFLVILAFAPIILLTATIYFLVGKYPISLILTCALFFCAFLLLWIYSFIDYRENSKPATMYERKVRDVQKAERELQKSS